MRRVFVRRIAVLLLAMLIGITAPTALLAASMEFTASIKSAWDKTVAKADNTMKAKLNVLYTDFSALKGAGTDTSEAIDTIHYANEQAELALRKQIKLIDAEKLKQLEKQVKETRIATSRYLRCTARKPTNYCR